VRPGAERADTDLGVRSTTRVRGIRWRRGPRIYVSPSERGGRSICRDHLLQAKESTRDSVVVRTGGGFIQNWPFLVNECNGDVSTVIRRFCVLVFCSNRLFYIGGKLGIKFPQYRQLVRCGLEIAHFCVGLSKPAMRVWCGGVNGDCLFQSGQCFFISGSANVRVR
jgi:hypothetical protein